MDATRLEVDLKPQQSMVCDVREELCVDANVEMSTRRDVVCPDVVDATARWTNDTLDDVCEAWIDAGVRMQQTIGVGVTGVGQAVDGSSRRYGSRMKRERTRQTIVEGESLVEVAHEDHVLDVASPREKFVVECTSQCDVVVVRREVIDASRHVRRHDEYAVVLLKLQHCGDEATGGGLEEAHAVGKKITRNKQSHSGIMSRWQARTPWCTGRRNRESKQGRRSLGERAREARDKCTDSARRGACEQAPDRR